MRHVIIGLLGLIVAIICLIGAFFVASYAPIISVVLLVLGLIAVLMAGDQRRKFARQ